MTDALTPYKVFAGGGGGCGGCVQSKKDNLTGKLYNDHKKLIRNFLAN